jgi:LPXTG-motif cell wall-anchored protein
MRSRPDVGAIARRAARLALVASLAGGFGFAVPHVALAQGNTDEAHSLCAQGGEQDGLGGAGGGGFGTFNPDDPANETANFGNGQGGGDDAGGNGGGGPGGGLGGAEDVGGGAGGCGADVVTPTAPPVCVNCFTVVRTRNLPTTGSPTQNVAFMGGGLLLAGAAFVGANRRARRRVPAVADGLVWDAFGGS